MKASEINKFILKNLITYRQIEIVLSNGKVIYGYLEYFEDSKELAKENKWYFVDKQNRSKDDFEILDGNDIKNIKNYEDQIRDYFKQQLHEVMENYKD